MSGVNRVILIGNLGKDPEVRHLESGVAVASFSLATSENYKDRKTGERKTITEWHNIVLWRGLAEVAEKYLHKGSKVYIEGKLRTRNWEDSEGNIRYQTEVIADNMVMLDRREDRDMPGASQAPAEKPQSNEAQLDKAIEKMDDSADDLPF